VAPIDPRVAELRQIEKEGNVALDDDSIRFVGQVRSDNLLRDDEWNQIKEFLGEALRFLSGPKKTAWREADGTLVIDPDADPRNANWLRIDRANRLAGYVLPMWAALWLWRLRTDSSNEFWSGIGKIAGKLGCEPFIEESDHSKTKPGVKSRGT
jgi:hypothetical protein